MLDIVNLIFTLINFGTFVALCTYLYQKYGRTLLFEAMAAQENETRLLELKALALKEEKIRLEHELIAQRNEAAMLQEKINRWRDVQDAQISHELTEQQDIQEALKAKAHAQSQWYARYQLAQRLLPQVLSKTRAQLTARFKEDSVKQAYTQDILTHMKKSQ